MKLFKLILICVMTTLLVISITLNIFLLCGFRFTKDTDSQITDTPTKVYTSETQTESSEDTVTESNPTNRLNSSEDSNKSTEVEPISIAVYKDANVKVTYVQSNDSPAGIIHNFKIENLSSKTLTVVFTDIFVNRHPVYSSGLTCEKILPGATAVEELVLLDREYKLSITSEHEISFIIKLINAKSYLDLYNSNRITLEF